MILKLLLISVKLLQLAKDFLIKNIISVYLLTSNNLLECCENVNEFNFLHLYILDLNFNLSLIVLYSSYQFRVHDGLNTFKP